MDTKREKSKISIRVQFAIIFASLTIFTLVIFLLINTVFLDDFYVKNKEKAIKEAYTSLAAAVANSTLESEEFDAHLDSVVAKYNIDVIVVDVDSKTVSLKAKDREAIRIAVWDKIFMNENPNAEDKIVEKTDDYQLSIMTDFRTGIEYIEMWGFLKNDNIFLMRSALQSIEESARITNLFLVYIGLIVIILGIIVVVAVSSRLTRPILELADISEKMGKLDFEAKYTGKQNNEIGLLGDNINRMSKTLEKTISELKTANIELQRDIEKKEQAEEMRSEFLSAVSHELKTPIAIIRGYAEGLVEGVTDDKESMDYYCNVISDEADKMNNIVMKLLSLNELEFGSNNVSMERFDIVTLIKNRLQETEVLAKQKDFDIIFSQEKPIFVWGDEFKAEDVFSNYISNAINHCSGENKIIISLKENDNKVRINVFNTGEQIPEECLEHLFEKFYKVDKARTRDYGGSGIGLSIVKAIQESINQQYGVINEENGVSFWFEMERA